MPDPEKTIVLVGFKASGKSTVGRLLARRLNREFADTDALVEESFERDTGESLPFRAIYRLEGKERFVAREMRALAELLARPPMIVSFGGGTLGNAVDRGVDLSGVIVVGLQVEKEALYRRMMAGGRPAFLDESDPKGSFDRLWDERTPLFATHAAFMVENNQRPPAETVEEIVARLTEIDDHGR